MLKTNCAVAQSVEELKFILSKSNKSLTVIPLDLAVQIYCIKNNISFFDPINYIGNSFHKSSLNHSEKIIQNLKFKNLKYESHKLIVKAFLRFRFNSIIFLRELLDNICKRNKVKNIIFSGWYNYEDQYSSKNYFISYLAKKIFKNNKIKFLTNGKISKQKKKYFISYDIKITDYLKSKKFVLLSNLGYNFFRLVKNCKKNKILVLTPFDKKINFLKRIIFYFFNVRFFYFAEKNEKIKNFAVPSICINYNNKKIKDLLLSRFKEETHNLLFLISKSKAINQLFKETKISSVFSAMTRGEFGYYLEYAEKKGIPSVSIPHGTLTESFNKNDSKYKSIIAEAITTKKSKYLAIQSPIAERFIRQKNKSFRKKGIKTGNLIFSENYKNYNSDSKVKVLYAVTLKNFESIQFLGVEMYYEFLNNLYFLNNFSQKNNFHIIVKLHPSGVDCINDLRIIFPNLIFTNEKIQKVLQKVDLTISFSSTVIEDSLYSYRPVILLDRRKRYLHCMAQKNLRGRNSALYYINNENDLKNCILKIKSNKNLSFKNYIYEGRSNFNIENLIRDLK